ncbi:hypothetical protein N0V90_003132 [Kalmusia sp. IMI 367209]|nr:hypothetical protein N0V90_003132 [Kalmusia sp. IMI 367209]
MGRFATLKPETQDMVNAMLPAIASAFKIDPADFKEIIPEDIRMREWDCERRDHIKDKTDDEPRNWGVQFLKELQAIARLNGGDLAAFQTVLRAKVAKHAEKHPWARLEDIKEIKAKYQNPEIPSEDDRDPDAYESDSESSLDSYLEELVEQELPKGVKRGRNETYESRVQGYGKVRKPRKPVRLRRDDSAGWDRRGKDKGRNMGQVSVSSRNSIRSRRTSTPRDLKRRGRSRSASLLQDIQRLEDASEPMAIIEEDSDDEPAEVKKLQAELEAAEAELHLKRTKLKYWDAKAKAQAEKEAKEVKEVNQGREEEQKNAGLKGYSLPAGHPGRQGLQGFPIPVEDEYEYDYEDEDDDEDEDEDEDDGEE